MSDSADSPEIPKNQPISGAYDSSQLGKLEGLEAVRKKPGMYIGGTDERALHHCVSEVLDNSVDEHLAGHCDHIDVTIHVDGSISIRDNGRGIPVDIHPQYKIPGVEMVLTTLHSGGKYGQGGYKFSGGTHGVGAKCVNAVSEWFEVEVSRDGEIHAMQDVGLAVPGLQVFDGKKRGARIKHDRSPYRLRAPPPKSRPLRRSLRRESDRANAHGLGGECTEVGSLLSRVWFGADPSGGFSCRDSKIRAFAAPAYFGET